MDLEEHAQNIRRNILEAGYKAGAMHFGGALSIADILAMLYGEVMRYDVTNPTWEERDRFILSKGHCGLALYAALAEFGFITHEQLMTVDDNGGDFPSHCVQHVEYGIELSSGSLGLGLSFAIGQALGLQPSTSNLQPPQLYVVVGNGEANEGSFWEAVMFAGAKGVSNVCLILDDNGMQLDGFSADVMPVTNWGERLAAFGWMVAAAEGHDFASLRTAFQTPRNGKPIAVIAKTVKGKGVSFMENVPAWHHNKMTEEQYNMAMAEVEEIEQSNNRTIKRSPQGGVL